MKIKNIAVILAGGSGTRLSSELPKQFLKVAGKSLIEHTISVFDNHNEIDEICVVCHTDYVDKLENLVLDTKFSKVNKILIGGQERFESSLVAINAYHEECNMIFHDAVRPLVSDSIIDSVIDALNEYSAVDVAVLSSDTIIVVNELNQIVSIPDRNMLRRGQTPQAFKRSVIKKAYDIALLDPQFKSTDDCGVIVRYLPDQAVYVVDGEQSNIKATYKEDLFLIDKLFQLKSIEFDSSLSPAQRIFLEDKVIVVFGGSSGIGLEICNQAKMLGMKVFSFSRTQNNVDITDYKIIADTLAQVFNIEGKIDFIIDTAALLIKAPIHSIEYDKIDYSVDLNLKSLFYLAKESYRYLKSSNGQILFFTSSSYTRGRAMYSVYSSTKAATVNFVQAVAEEWVTDKIRVNCINPERTKTPMRLKNFGIEPDGTLLDPSTVALVSLKALTLNITGQVIDVNLKN